MFGVSAAIIGSSVIGIAGAYKQRAAQLRAQAKMAQTEQRISALNQRAAFFEKQVALIDKGSLHEQLTKQPVTEIKWYTGIAINADRSPGPSLRIIEQKLQPPVLPFQPRPRERWVAFLTLLIGTPLELLAAHLIDREADRLARFFNE